MFLNNFHSNNQNSNYSEIASTAFNNDIINGNESYDDITNSSNQIKYNNNNTFCTNNNEDNEINANINLVSNTNQTLHIINEKKQNKGKKDENEDENKNEIENENENENEIENDENENEINKSLESKWDVKHSSIAPNFIANYYENSRLHYLSLWKNKLKSIINSQINISKFKDYTNKTKFIMHVDMDCFFVSVGLISRPELINKPVGVSHSSGKNSGSDIASCNYVARAFGVKNGMLIAHAKKVCPNLVVIPYEFENYERVTTVLYNVLINNSDNIQAVSCDEAYIEIWLPRTGTEEADIIEKAKSIRAEIKYKTECNASIGISTNLLLARLATKKAKPNGEFYLSPTAPENFIKQFEVSDLPGVGWSIAKRFNDMNINNCGDLQKLSLSTLQKEFGKKTGQKLYNLCRGIDDRELNSESNERRSISAEITWGIRFNNDEQFKKFINDLAIEVSERMKRENKKGQKLTIKLKIRYEDADKPMKRLGHGSCKNMSKSLNLHTYIYKSEDISKYSWNIISSLKPNPKEVRGIGVQLSKLKELSNLHDSQQKLKFNTINNCLSNNNEDNDNNANNDDDNNCNNVKINYSNNSINNYLILNNDNNSSNSSSTSSSNNNNNDDDDNNEIIDMNKEIIDPSVLSELPKEIQEELIQYYNLSKNGIINNNNPQNSNKNNNSVDKINNNNNSPEDIVSTHKADIINNETQHKVYNTLLKVKKERKKRGRKKKNTISVESKNNKSITLSTKKENKINELLPSPSKIDLDVMNELPLTIQEEIIQIYHDKKEKEEKKENSIITLTQFWNNTKSNTNKINTGKKKDNYNNNKNNNSNNDDENSNFNNKISNNNNNNSNNNNSSLQLINVIKNTSPSEFNNQNNNFNKNIIPHSPLLHKHKTIINKKVKNNNSINEENEITNYHDVEELIRQWVELFNDIECDVKSIIFNNNYELYEEVINFIEKIQNKIIESLNWFVKDGNDLTNLMALMSFFERLINNCNIECQWDCSFHYEGKLFYYHLYNTIQKECKKKFEGNRLHIRY
ncbi:hypothetical protein BCR36DRAFT_409079, partial [Piromyces finnis]